MDKVQGEILLEEHLARLETLVKYGEAITKKVIVQEEERSYFQKLMDDFKTRLNQEFKNAQIDFNQGLGEYKNIVGAKSVKQCLTRYTKAIDQMKEMGILNQNGKQNQY